MDIDGARNPSRRRRGRMLIEERRARQTRPRETLHSGIWEMPRVFPQRLHVTQFRKRSRTLIREMSRQSSPTCLDIGGPVTGIDIALAIAARPPASCLTAITCPPVSTRFPEPPPPCRALRSSANQLIPRHYATGL